MRRQRAAFQTRKSLTVSSDVSYRPWCYTRVACLQTRCPPPWEHPAHQRGSMTTNRRASLWVSLCLRPGGAGRVAQYDLAADRRSGPPPAHLSPHRRPRLRRPRRPLRRSRGEPAAARWRPPAHRRRPRRGDAAGRLAAAPRSSTRRPTSSRADLLRLLQGRVFSSCAARANPQRAVRYQIDAPGGLGANRRAGRVPRLGGRDHARPRGGTRGVARAGHTGQRRRRRGRARRRAVASCATASRPARRSTSTPPAGTTSTAGARPAAIELLGAASAQYLPDELDVYASTFDHYGTWRSDPADGNVWYPAGRADWRPYSVGYWRTYPAWGSFWIGGDPWGWPTHHYGRWGFSFSFGWYWMPRRSGGPRGCPGPIRPATSAGARSAATTIPCSGTGACTATTTAGHLTRGAAGR